MKAWTLDDLISDEQFAELLAQAPAALGQFCEPDGSVAFPAPAIVAIRVSPLTGRRPGATLESWHTGRPASSADATTRPPTSSSACEPTGLLSRDLLLCDEHEDEFLEVGVLHLSA